MEIDRTNKRILALIENNARLSVTALGREIGLSRPAVQDRISTMEQQGIIEGYHTKISENAGLVHAFISVKISERPCEKALRWLASLNGINSVMSLAGEIDAIVSVTLANTDELSALNDKIAGSSLISSSRSQIILRRYSKNSA